MYDRNTLLIVDDQEINRLILREILNTEAQIMEAADGNEALQIIGAILPQLAVVFLAADMPGMDGFEVLRMMKTRGWLESVPVFLIVAERAEDSLAQGYELGITDVITKPFYAAEIKQRASNAMELYRYRFELKSVVHEKTAHIREGEERPTIQLMQSEKQIKLVSPVGQQIDVNPQTLFEFEQEKYRVMAEFSEDMVFTYNALFGSMEFNEKLCKMFQVPSYINDYKMQEPPRRIFFPEEYKQLMEKRRRLNWTSPEMEMDLRLLLPNGNYLWFHLVLRVLLDQKEHTRELGYIGKLVNINRIKSEATEWQTRANTDPLTQLYNRAGAHILFEQMRRGEEIPLTVAFLDIDYFKRLNDTLGHGAGDQILTLIGKKIRSYFRPDDIVSRFGGDEFLIVMKNVGDRAFAKKKLEQLCCQTLSISCHPEPMIIKSSVGVAFCPEDGVEFDELLRKADRALYKSKQNGRGRVSFYEEEGQELK